MNGIFSSIAGRAALGLLLIYSSGAAAVDTNIISSLKKHSVSVFDDRLPEGRDPFFPDSTRRESQVPVIVTNKTQEKTTRISEPASLTLNGVIGARTALINNQTFIAGETKYVRTSKGNVRVTCIAVQNSFVTIEVEGVPGRKELKLKEGR